MWSNLLWLDLAQRQCIDDLAWNLYARLHEMFWELIPHSLVPLALHRHLCLGQVFPSIVFLRALAKLFIHFGEPLKDFISRHIFQTLLLDIAVNVSA